MFLNDIGQPLILNSNKQYGPYEEHNGPMLLTSAAFGEHVIPKNWCRQIIGSANDVALFKAAEAEPNPAYSYTELKPSVPTIITYKEVTNVLTLIPAGENRDGESINLYYLKNDYIRALIVDRFTEYFDFIPKAGASFHRTLSFGIDVMYIDDLCYMSNDDEALSQQENIYALVQLIRPKYVYGLRQDNLPKYLSDLCVPRNLNEAQQNSAAS